MIWVIWHAKRSSKKRRFSWSELSFWCRIFSLAFGLRNVPYLTFRDLPIMPSPRPVEPLTAMMCWTMPRLEPRPKNFLHKFCSDYLSYLSTYLAKLGLPTYLCSRRGVLSSTREETEGERETAQPPESLATLCSPYWTRGTSPLVG